MGFFLINWLVFSLWAQECSQDFNEPQVLIEQILQASRQSESLPQFLDNIKISKGTSVGAKTSFSIQKSMASIVPNLATHYDPRIFIQTPCFIFTFTLFGDSLEVGIKNQKAQIPIFDRGELKSYINQRSEGLLFLSIKNFSPANKFLKVEDILNYWDESKFEGKKKVPYNFVFDSKRCGQCHVTQGEPRARAFGLREVRVEGSKLLTVINPYYDHPKSRSVEGELFCVPRDLVFLEECLCGAKTAACQVFREPKISPTPGELKLACDKLKAVNQINPQQNPLYDPLEHKQRCFSGN